MMKKFVTKKDFNTKLKLDSPFVLSQYRKNMNNMLPYIRIVNYHKNKYERVSN